MKKIESLTEDQIAKFPDYVKKWTEIGLCTEPVNRPEAEKAIHKCYELADLKKPEKIIWCDSPLSQGIVRAILMNESIMKKIGDNVSKSIADVDKIKESLRGSAGRLLYNKIIDSVMYSINERVDWPVRGLATKIWSSLDENVLALRSSVYLAILELSNKVHSLLSASASDSVMSEVDTKTWEPVDGLTDSIYASVREAILNEVGGTSDSVFDSVSDSVKLSLVARAISEVDVQSLESVSDSVKSSLINDEAFKAVDEALKKSISLSLANLINDKLGKLLRSELDFDLFSLTDKSLDNAVSNKMFVETCRIFDSVIQATNSISDQIEDSIYNIVGKVFQSELDADLIMSTSDALMDSISKSVWKYVYESVKDTVQSLMGDTGVHLVNLLISGESVKDLIRENVGKSINDPLWEKEPINSVSQSVIDIVHKSIREPVRDTLNSISIWDEISEDAERKSVKDSFGKPVDSEMFHNLVNGMSSIRKSVSDAVENTIHNSVWDSTRVKVWESISRQISDSVTESVIEHVGKPVSDTIRSKIRDSISESVSESVGEAVGFKMSEETRVTAAISLHEVLTRGIISQASESISSQIRESMNTIRIQIRDSVTESAIEHVGKPVMGKLFEDKKETSFNSVVKKISDDMLEKVVRLLLIPTQILILETGSKISGSVSELASEHVGEAVESKILHHLCKSVSDSIEKAVSESISNLVYNSISYRVGEALDGKIWAQAWESSVRDAVKNTILKEISDNYKSGKSVRNELYDLVHDAVLKSVRETTGESLLNKVFLLAYETSKESLIHSNQIEVTYLRNTITESLKDILSSDEFLPDIMKSVGNSLFDTVYGFHLAGILSFYEYFKNEVGLAEETKRMEGLFDLAKNCGWIIPHENICFASERPCILNRDDRGRIHSFTQPAVMYPDGWKIYAIHGVRVPEYLITNPKEITVEKIESEQNVEIRRIMIDIYGPKNYIEDCGAQLIHEDRYGKLYKKTLEDDEDIVMIKVINSTKEPDGTFKEYFLRVPPDMERARQAVAWTFGKTEQEYNPLLET